MIKQFASLLLLVMTACGNQKPPDHALHPSAAAEEGTTGMYTTDTKIAEVMDDPVFGNYGRLIFPADNGYYGGDTLGDLSLIWYTHIDPEMTVEVANYFREHTQKGNVIFYDIYTDEEKAADPEKEDTGLFFFKGEPGAKFAVCNAGGAFAYVGAMHDSFPHALELSKQGYNAFALIYRPGAQTACEDLARAINFIFAHADELEVDTDCYSLWGGSAGARMAAWLGSYGPAAFGGDDLPRPGTVVMQYTGLSGYSSDDPPPMSAWETATALPAGAPCSAVWRPCQSLVSTRSSTVIPALVTVSALALAPWPRAGSTTRLHFGKTINRRNKSMRKDFGAKPYLFPQPVLIIGSYNEDGSANAMNAAWGGIVGADEIIIDLSSHQTTDNILLNKAFTVSVGDVEHLTACDYVGLVSAKNEPRKMEKAGFTTMKSAFVNAPVINELPLTLECELVKVIDGSKYLGVIQNVNADERILGEDGAIDPAKLQAISFDPVHHAYLKLGEKVGNAFQDGAVLK